MRLPIVVLGIVTPTALLSRRSGNDFAFDYSKSGMDWVQGMCASRERQSPIDFPWTPDKGPDGQPFQPKPPLYYSYEDIRENFEVLNSGHEIVVSLVGRGYGGVTYNRQTYDLQQLIVRAHSEHTFFGKSRPLEVQVVHQSTSGPAQLVVSTTFEPPGSAWTPSLATVNTSLGTADDYLPPSEDDPGFAPIMNIFLGNKLPGPAGKLTGYATELSPFRLVDLLEDNGGFFEYSGSMTAPPCAEIVTWMVRRTALKASARQIQLLHDAIYSATDGKGNSRLTMPLNNRIVGYVHTVEGIPPVGELTEATPAPIPADATLPKWRAEQWASQSVMVAKDALDYVKDLDQRLRAAANAQAEAMAPDMFGTPKEVPGVSSAVTTPTPVNPTAVALAKYAKMMESGLRAAAKQTVLDTEEELEKQVAHAAQAQAQKNIDVVQQQQARPTAEDSVGAVSTMAMGGAAPAHVAIRGATGYGSPVQAYYASQAR
mmetsp:Transcript_94131/g.252046  ORF Transcript_94131/g.252046 Transcript_94131/m.252046 type:complete len:485 (-) Transcript_94131:77-1531(-)